MKKILLYCHDTMGFGHISRMLNLYRTLQKDNTLHIIFGGKIPKDHLHDISFSSLRCDSEGKNIHYGELTSDIKEQRLLQLDDILQDFEPDIVLIDYYPFGRLSLHREIDTLIKNSKDKYHAKVYSVMRDIFSGKKCFSQEDFDSFSRLVQENFSKGYQDCIEEDIERFYSFGMWKRIEKSILSQMLLEYYFSKNFLDGIIVFGDKDLYRIEDEFFLNDKMRQRFIYMGYLLPQSYSCEKATKGEYILMSFGGSVFHTQNYLRLLKILSELNYPVKCMVPFFEKNEYQKIEEYFKQYPHIQFVEFSGDFSSYIKDASFYICAGGYGSMMDIMYYKIPALIALNFNQDIEINETEDGKRFEILHGKLSLSFFDEKTKASDVLCILKSGYNDFDFSGIEKSGAKNIQDFFTYL